MNFCKGQNAFSDIPGFDASKGERIVKALQKLREKIQYLERIRNSEKRSRTEETPGNLNDEDLTITDVQYKLLVLQLQYARSILRKKFAKDSTAIHSKLKEGDQYSDNLNSHCVKKNKYCRDFEAENNLTESNPYKRSDSYISKDATRIDIQVSTDDQLFESENPSVQPPLITYKTSSSKPHYHLKLDDVPFILGASSTASHSVVANVQNIIARMKCHNKALCGPKQISKSIVNASNAGRDTQDTTKMLNDLSRDLCELALKQKKLVKSIDATQGKNEATNVSKNFQRDDKKHTADSCARRLHSNSESEVKLHAEVKNFSKRRENDFGKSNVQHKQNVLNVRNYPNNLSMMDRRKLLRSLQNFKTHLSEEDISWD